MRTIQDEQTEARDALLVLENLGAAVGLQIRATIDEPVPAQMGLLLLRLALVEMLKDDIEQQAQEDAPEPLSEEWALTLRQTLDLIQWRRSRPLAAGQSR